MFELIFWPNRVDEVYFLPICVTADGEEGVSIGNVRGTSDCYQWKWGLRDPLFSLQVERLNIQVVTIICPSVIRS